MGLWNAVKITGHLVGYAGKKVIEAQNRQNEEARGCVRETFNRMEDDKNQQNKQNFINYAHSELDSANLSRESKQILNDKLGKLK